jgi:pyruvate formate lyase activating enzyme
VKGKDLTRREFISKTGFFLGGVSAALMSPVLLDKIYSLAKNGFQPDYLQELIESAPAAKYWLFSNSADAGCASCHDSNQIKSNKQYDHKEKFIKCLLCAQGCVIKENERGRCRARINAGGTLKSLVYGRPISIHVDPIEKKPLFHFLPGTEAYSLATAGCPLSCQFCQNWEISQAKPEDFRVKYTSPADITEGAISNRVPTIAFTYNEPTVFFEYLTDIARSAKKKKIKSILISCGFMNSEPLKELCEVLDAIKIDLKGFSGDFYRKVCSAELKPVLSTIRQIAKSKVHLEIVNLVVPTLNDSDKMLGELSEWIAGEAGVDVPVHFTRFHPDYKLLNLPPTQVSTLERARGIAMSKGIHYAFVGNVPGNAGNSTYCPSCGKIVIKRDGLFTTEINLKKGKCVYCGRSIAGVWE